MPPTLPGLPCALSLTSHLRNRLCIAKSAERAMTKKQLTIICSIYCQLGAEHFPGIHAYVQDIRDSDGTAGSNHERIVS